MKKSLLLLLLSVNFLNSSEFYGDEDFGTYPQKENVSDADRKEAEDEQNRPDIFLINESGENFQFRFGFSKSPIDGGRWSNTDLSELVQRKLKFQIENFDSQFNFKNHKLFNEFFDSENNFFLLAVFENAYLKCIKVFSMNLVDSKIKTLGKTKSDSITITVECGDDKQINFSVK